MMHILIFTKELQEICLWDFIAQVEKIRVSGKMNRHDNDDESDQEIDDEPSSNMSQPGITPSPVLPVWLDDPLSSGKTLPLQLLPRHVHAPKYFMRV